MKQAKKTVKGVSKKKADKENSENNSKVNDVCMTLFFIGSTNNKTVLNNCFKILKHQKIYEFKFQFTASFRGSSLGEFRTYHFTLNWFRNSLTQKNNFNG